MAYENGDNIFSYYGDVFKRYINDPFIFVKALQIINYFEKRKDYPANFDDLDKAVCNILGESLTSFSYNSKYINDERMDWDPKTSIFYREGEPCGYYEFFDGIEEERKTILVLNFKNELKAFNGTVEPTLNQIYNAPNPLGIRKVVCGSNQNGYVKIFLIRNDQSMFDLNLNSYDIDFLVESLKKVNKIEE